ncbi:MAG: hypothetical protein HUU16_09080 [Candidatus Omnitrophica bacterium]|nr:hypothetical protein [Candidatus Omnitrophota bacterium]
MPRILISFLLALSILGGDPARVWAADSAPPAVSPITEADLHPKTHTPVSAGIKDVVEQSVDLILPPLSEEESADLYDADQVGLTPECLRVGVVRPVEIDGPILGKAAYGKFTPLSTGRVWTVRIRSIDAKGLRVHFEGVDLAEGETLVVYDPASPVSRDAPATGKGPNSDGEFYSPTVFAEEILIEYRFVAETEFPRFRVTGIVHLAEKPPAPDGEKVDLSCHNDITCYAPSYSYKSGIGRMLFADGQSAYVCTGALLIDTAQTFVRNFLTANHCISTQAVVNTLEVYWLYETPTCNGAPPSLNSLNKSTGGTLRATRGADVSDFTLILLNSAPGGLVYLGWSADDGFVGSMVHGIHHPDGSFKRISFGSITQDFNFAGYDENNYWVVAWNSGATEGGSSGSPLIVGNGTLIGTLTGGTDPNLYDPCTDGRARDLYGRFSETYPFIQGYLNTGSPITATPTRTATRTRTATPSGTPTRTPTRTQTQTGNPSATPTFASPSPDNLFRYSRVWQSAGNGPAELLRILSLN